MQSALLIFDRAEHISSNRTVVSIRRLFVPSGKCRADAEGGRRRLWLYGGMRRVAGEGRQTGAAAPWWETAIAVGERGSSGELARGDGAPSAQTNAGRPDGTPLSPASL